MEKHKSIVDSILNVVDCLAMLLMIVPLAISLLITYASIDTSQFVQKFLLAIHENAFIIMFFSFCVGTITSFVAKLREERRKECVLEYSNKYLDSNASSTKSRLELRLLSKKEIT